MLTCTGVSYGHGSNDGQKGMGLIMLILIGILPTTYAVDTSTSQASIEELARTTQDDFEPHGPSCSWRRDGGISGRRRRTFGLPEDHRQIDRADLRGHRHQVPRDQ